MHLRTARTLQVHSQSGPGWTWARFVSFLGPLQVHSRENPSIWRRTWRKTRCNFPCFFWEWPNHLTTFAPFRYSGPLHVHSRAELRENPCNATSPLQSRTRVTQQVHSRDFPRFVDVPTKCKPASQAVGSAMTLLHNGKSASLSTD